MKVYCKNCKYFPRWRLHGKRLAICKVYERDSELAFYSPEYPTPMKHYKFCDVQNKDNDCLYYDVKYP